MTADKLNISLTGQQTQMDPHIEEQALGDISTAAQTPTIILEHAGPVITTVDFGGGLSGQQPGDYEYDEPDDEDDDGSEQAATYYDTRASYT